MRVEVKTQVEFDLEVSKGNTVVVRSGFFVAWGNSSVVAWGKQLCRSVGERFCSIIFCIQNKGIRKCCNHGTW